MKRHCVIRFTEWKRETESKGKILRFLENQFDGYERLCEDASWIISRWNREIQPPWMFRSYRDRSRRWLIYLCNVWNRFQTSKQRRERERERERERCFQIKKSSMVVRPKSRDDDSHSGFNFQSCKGVPLFAPLFISGTSFLSTPHNIIMNFLFFLNHSHFISNCTQFGTLTSMHIAHYFDNNQFNIL